MIELPEASVLAVQAGRTLTGKRIARTVANHSPQKFAWYTGDPANYPYLLEGGVIGQAAAFGNHVEIQVSKPADDQRWLKL